MAVGHSRFTKQSFLKLLDAGDLPPGDIGKYIEIVPDPERPFSLTVRYNSEYFETEAQAEGVVRDGLIDGLNKLFAARRQADFYDRIEANPNLLRLVAQGDSWFQYPNPVDSGDDLIDHLVASERYAVYCMSAAGDTLEAMVADLETLRQAITKTGAQALLFSAGGNDFAATDRDGLMTYIRNYNRDFAAADYVSSGFSEFLQSIIAKYMAIFEDIWQMYPQLPIFIHGYDRPFPISDGTWLGPRLHDKGIPEAFWAPIVGTMIDHFNEMLKTLALENGERLNFVDCRGSIGDADQWRDELHGKNDGCYRAALRFQDAIDAVFETAPAMA